MTLTHEKNEMLITTDYSGARYPQEVGDKVTVQLHGKNYNTVVLSHTYFSGFIGGGSITYKVLDKDEDWKKLTIKD